MTDEGNVLPPIPLYTKGEYMTIVNALNVDEVLFDKKPKVTRGVKTNDVKNVKKCPICECASFVVVDGNINHFACGTSIKVREEKSKSGSKQLRGTLIQKCAYNVFNFYRENDYDPSVHYDPTYLESLGITITGCDMTTNYPAPIDVEQPHIKIYEKDGHITLSKTSKLVGTAVIRKDNSEVRNAIERYIKDYNSIKDKDIWSFTVTNNRGEYVDSLLGLVGNGYEIGKEYMDEYGIYKEDYEKFWKDRIDF